MRLERGRVLWPVRFERERVRSERGTECEEEGGLVLIKIKILVKIKEPGFYGFNNSHCVFK